MRTRIRSLAAGLAGALLAGCGSGGASNPPVDIVFAASVAGEAPRLLGGGLRGEGLDAIDGGVPGSNRYAWSPDRTRVAFVSEDAAGDDRMYVVALADGVAVPVTPPATPGNYISYPKWSPDSARLAFAANLVDDALDTYELWVTDGAGLAIQVSGTESVMTIAEPFWSPDATKLAYGGQVAGTQPNGAVSLWVVGADGTGRTKVSGTLVAGGSVSWNSPNGADGAGIYGIWSHDGQRVAFLADKDTDDVFELWTVKPDGTGLVKVLSASPTTDVYAFQWSPTAPQLFGVRSGSGTQLWVIPAAGGAPVAVSGAAEVLAPWITTWSPDGSRIAYTASGSTLVRTVAPDGSGVRTLATAPDDGVPSSGLRWAPTGGRLGYVAGIDGVADPDHFLLYAVLDAPGATPILLSPQVSPTDGNVTDSGWSWSPDGTRLAYRARLGATGSHDLFLVAADGNGLQQVTALPGDGWVTDVGWSTDGARFVWTEGDTDDGTFRIRSCDPSGTSIRTILDDDVVTPAGWVDWPEVR